MRGIVRKLIISSLFSLGLVTSYTVNAADADKAASAEKTLTPVEEGKKLVFDQMKGNCLACHMIVGGDLPGNIGPPLVGMKERFPDKAKLRAQIYDPRVANPKTMMIPFGPMGILTDEELDKVVEYVYTL
jgi:sulfur-oxidizing protein SoxX